jgi:hypothetical protein
MSCKWCQSTNRSKFLSEVSIHFPGVTNVTKPPVWAFPELVVCLDCGFTEFRIERAELSLLGPCKAETAA